MRDITAETPGRPDMTWDFLIRLSGAALFVLLVVAYSTGEEFPHTHKMIGYAIAALLAAGIFWAIIRPRHNRFPTTVYSPREIKAQFRTLPKALGFIFLVLAALPFCAFILMMLTHTLWGTTWIDEMHEVVAYFTLGLVVFYVVMVAIASIRHVEDRFRTVLKGKKH